MTNSHPSVDAGKRKSMSEADDKWIRDMAAKEDGSNVNIGTPFSEPAEDSEGEHFIGTEEMRKR